MTIPGIKIPWMSKNRKSGGDALLAMVRENFSRAGVENRGTSFGCRDFPSVIWRSPP